MTIDLTKEEIAILDAALVSWQNAPGADGFVGSIFSAIFGKESDPETRRVEMRNEIEGAKKEVRQRELQAMRLRLKLMEVQHRAGEFENTPPHRWLSHERN